MAGQASDLRALPASIADAGLLQRERRGNQQVYSADTACPIFTELASILRKSSGLADVLAKALAPLADQVRVAFVAEFAAKVADEPYLRDVLVKPKIFLKGRDDDFAELAGTHAGHGDA